SGRAKTRGRRMIGKLGRGVTAALFVLLAFLIGQEALACACCTSIAERTDLVMPLDKGYAEELEKLRFKPQVELFLGEADPEMVQGIKTPSAKYEVATSWKNDRFVFEFRDQAGHSGSLVLKRPTTLSIFHVDTRLGPVNPEARVREPVLYKEWR